MQFSRVTYHVASAYSLPLNTIGMPNRCLTLDGNHHQQWMSIARELSHESSVGDCRAKAAAFPVSGLSPNGLSNAKQQGISCIFIILFSRPKNLKDYDDSS